MTATTLPARSTGVRWAPLGMGLLLHDEVRAQVHLLNATGALVWEACDGATATLDLAREVATATGADPDDVQRDIHLHLDELAAMGLVGRVSAEPPVVLPPPYRAAGHHRSRTLRVLDAGVQLVADDPELLAEPCALLADLEVEEPTFGGRELLEVGLERAGTQVRVQGRGYDAIVEHGPELAEAVLGLLNRTTTWAATPLALHAGAVAASDGRVVLVAGPSGSGKSTLVASLVQAGWSYLTDEAVGIRPDLTAVAYPKPLALSQGSRHVLGLGQGPELVRASELGGGATMPPGGAGPVTAIVVAGYRPGPVEVGRVVLGDAMVALAPHLINLGSAGQGGLEVLVRALDELPVIRLAHPGGAAAVEAVDQVGRSA